MDEKEEWITPGYALDIIDENHKEEKKKLWFMVVLLVLMLFLSNMCWIIYEFQFHDEVITSTQTVSQNAGNGDNSFVGDFYGGDYNGETDYNSNSNN